MGKAYEDLKRSLREKPRRWLVTGAAGFIGSNLVETLLALGQTVTGMDNFATGHAANLDLIREAVGLEAWKRFRFVEGDIRDQAACREAMSGAELLLHQAALGSVPRSIKDPATSNAVNVDGFVNILLAARDAGVKRAVYASSSSVYGDSPELPKREDRIGKPLSPYAVTKLVNEHYAGVFSALYGLELIGLRYFNVFGPRQDPLGDYAAVIPKWVQVMKDGGTCLINGDGETSRDFCFIDNVVQANLLSACSRSGEAIDKVYNIACGERTTLNQLIEILSENVAAPGAPKPKVSYGPAREGDVRHSLANIDRARELLGYDPELPAREGLKRTVAWFMSR